MQLLNTQILPKNITLSDQKYYQTIKYVRIQIYGTEKKEKEKTDNYQIYTILMILMASIY